MHMCHTLVEYNQIELFRKLDFFEIVRGGESVDYAHHMATTGVAENDCGRHIFAYDRHKKPSLVEGFFKSSHLQRQVILHGGSIIGDVPGLLHNALGLWNLFELHHGLKFSFRTFVANHAPYRVGGF